MTVVLIFLAAVVLALLGLGFYFARVLIFPFNRTYEKTEAAEIDHKALTEDEWETMPKDAVRITSPFGYSLAACYLPCQGSQKGIIISHGITNNLIGSIKYAKIFLTLGFNVLVYDHRNHGKSGGKNTTFGFYEQHDLIAVVDWLLENHGPMNTIGLHGESMGAAIVILAAALDDRIDFVISDCSYANFRDQITCRLRKDYHLPAFPLLPAARLWTRLLTGMRFQDLDPEKAMPNVNAPVLIIHGACDKYIPPDHAQRLLSASTAEEATSLWLAPGAGHAESLWQQPQPYQQQVTSFLQKYGGIKTR